MKAYIVTK